MATHSSILAWEIPWTKEPGELYTKWSQESDTTERAHTLLGFSGGSVVKNLPVYRRCGFNPWVRKIPWKRKWKPTPVFLSGKSHGQKSLVGYSP